MKKIILVLTLALFLNNCSKKSEDTLSSKDTSYEIFNKGNQPQSEHKTITLDNKNTPPIVTQKTSKKELDFEVHNTTGKTVYITCFSYIQKESLTRWRWDKSPVYKLENNSSVFVNIDTIPDDENREYIFGYLAVFTNEKEANKAIYELVDDSKKIDLDRLHYLHNKKIVLKVEKYGFKKDLIDFSIMKQLKKKDPIHELDFAIENQTGKTIFVAGFIYQNKDNVRTVWTYDKTPVQRLEPGQISIIDVDTIPDPRNRSYMSGFLAIFEEHQEQEAREITYELLQPKNKIALGRVSRIKNKKIIIEVEQYGIIGDISEFDIRPVVNILPSIQATGGKLIPTRKAAEIPKEHDFSKHNHHTEEKTEEVAIIPRKRKYKLFT